MFRTKICGVRLKSDVESVEQSGGDAVGLNFFPPSVRYVDPSSDLAIELAEECRKSNLLCIGVFVNETADRMRSVAERLGLDAIQMHGDESITVAQDLVSSGHRLIRAIKLPKEPFESEMLLERVRPWIAVGAHLILDADAGAGHGGSGKTLDWPSIHRWTVNRWTVNRWTVNHWTVHRWAEQVGDVSWTLAGGLKPENVADAIRASGAISVDTASGVECPKGVKHPGRIQDFVTQAKLAFQRDSS